MIKLCARLGLVSAALACVVGFSAPAAAEKRIALVVGNDTYQSVPSLQKAVNDARAMAQSLRKLGFTVITAENVNRRALSERLLAFDAMIGPGDTAFFFFAGHGFEIRGDNILLPTDVPAAKSGEEELVRDASFPVERIMDRLRARQVKTAILVLDACRDNPFEKPGTRSLSGSGGLAAMTPQQGVFLVFSAGAKQTALDRLSNDDRDSNSVFTRHFVRALETPGLTLVQIAKRTQAQVREAALSVHHEQLPGYYDQVIGDIVLNGRAGEAPAALPQPQLQVAALPPPVRPAAPEPSGPVNAPIANFMRHNTGWSVTLSFADPVSVISWRLGDTGPFRETGFLDVLDPRTRKRMPNPSIQLDADAPEGTLHVKYIDQSGQEFGPVPVRFDPLAALTRSQRQILEMTASGWLSFREFNGLLLYYTHLMSYRCAIREVRIGFDGAMADRPLALPPCNMKDPSAIPANATPYLKLPTTTKSVSVELTYRDGTQSEVKTFRR